MTTPEAWVTFQNIDDGEISIEKKVEAIDIVAHAPTHNSITKDQMVAVLCWIMDTFDFDTTGKEDPDDHNQM